MTTTRTPKPITQDPTFRAWPETLTAENVRTLFASGDIDGVARDINRLVDTNNTSASKKERKS